MLLDIKTRNTIIKYRETGYSIPEIASLTGVSRTTVWKYATKVKVIEKYKQSLAAKRGGSHKRAIARWKHAQQLAHELVADISTRDMLIILSSLYWAEGTKKEFTFTNTDPIMIRVVTEGLRIIGVDFNELKMSIRIYEDMVGKEDEIKKYWLGVIGQDPVTHVTINVISGNKIGKLPYGMCRIRIVKGESYFKLIQSIIQLFKDTCPHSSRDRATDS